jgi:hypothetical protein
MMRSIPLRGFDTEMAAMVGWLVVVWIILSFSELFLVLESRLLITCNVMVHVFFGEWSLCRCNEQETAKSL